MTSAGIGELSATDRRRNLRKLMSAGEMIVAPSCFNALSARIIEDVGFKGIHVSGSSVSRSAGHADINLLGMSEVVSAHQEIAEATSIPVIGDSEAGFGGPVHVARSVRSFEKCGVAAVHIEDEYSPKAPGTVIGNHAAIPKEEMLDKLKAAVDARLDSEFVIVARSNARDREPFEQVMDRLCAYAETGVDAIWPGLFDHDECQQLRKYIKLPMVGSPHRAPSLKSFADYGFNVAVIPSVLGQVTTAAIAEFLEIFKETGSGEGYWKKHPNMDRWRKWWNSYGDEEEEKVLRVIGASK